MNEKKLGGDKARSSNLELMRIVLMFLIVIHHEVVNSGVMDGWETVPNTPASFVLVMLGMWGKSCINPFVMITGYFMCERELTARKTAKLLIQIAFWFILVNAFLLVIGKEGLIDAVKALATPLRDVDGNFIPSYIILYLLIPLLNTFIQSAGKRGVFLALGVLVWTQTILPTFFFSTASFSEVAWYVALYFMGAMVRLWPKRWMSNMKIISMLFVGSLCLSMLSVAALYRASILYSWPWQRSYFLVSDSGKLLSLANGFFCFLWFSGLRVRQSGMLNAVASTTFGILLIHANCPAMRDWLWADVFGIPLLYGSLDSLYVAFRIISSALIVFIFCSFLEWLRIRFLERPLLNCVFARWETCALRKSLNSLAERIETTETTERW